MSYSCPSSNITYFYSLCQFSFSFLFGWLPPSYAVNFLLKFHSFFFNFLRCVNFFFFNSTDLSRLTAQWFHNCIGVKLVDIHDVIPDCGAHFHIHVIKVSRLFTHSTAWYCTHTQARGNIAPPVGCQLSSPSLHLYYLSIVHPGKGGRTCRFCGC